MKISVWILFMSMALFCIKAEGVEMPAGHRGLTLPCETCHTTGSWTEMRDPIPFDHAQTGFALVDQHRNVDCATCHKNGDFVTVQQDCQSCHKDVHRAENGADCQRCHDSRSWIPTQEIDFHQATRFPLVGVHNLVDCQSCHVNQSKHEFVGLPTDCYSCHINDYAAAKSPDHADAQFSYDCAQCHPVSVPEWKPSTFDHNQTGFVLAGAHVTTECASCHVDGVFAGTPQDCFSCHQKDYVEVKDPDHLIARFGTDCLSCHTDDAWTPSTFDHNQTGFVLTGAHTTTDCASCHVDGVFTGTPTDCFSCHKADFEEVKNPDHVSAKFDTDCLVCHTDIAWTPSTFDHNQTGFSLTSAHTTTDCTSCHANGVFAGTPKDCFACHQQDYEKVDDPNHVLGRFSLLCLDCHTDTAWEPATFDHNQTRFPLTGQHNTVDCGSCHQNGVFQNTPMDCISCHQSDFNNARDPNHVFARFPEDCTQCHDTNRWDPSSFNHRSYFPIYSGEHRGEWNTCADCHTQPTDFKVFSCITCHEHRKSEMDDEHNDVRNYIYNSQECYRCHPDGRE